MVPTFGRSTIRRFVDNALAMKKLAARNYEDLLQVSAHLHGSIRTHLSSNQCAIPVFEGLLPPTHDKNVLDLLFLLAYWHSLAKLRLHTSFTLGRLDEVTASLGRQLRHFAKHTCPWFITKELPSEEAARGRRNAKKAASAAKKAGTAAPGANSAQPGGSSGKIFNLFTYKAHSLGDYVRTIRFFGTTDSYSTQTVRSRFCLNLFSNFIGRARAPSSQTVLCTHQQEQCCQADDAARAPRPGLAQDSPKAAFCRCHSTYRRTPGSPRT